MRATLHSNEAERLETLRQYEILDTLPEQAFDDITILASQICETPIALITLIDSDRQWFKSKVGLTMTETARDIAFCAHAIQQPDLLIVPDALKDKRFNDNPLVTSDPNIRFYAGVPLVTSEGRALGTLCVIDRVPRGLSAGQQEALSALSRQVMTQLELRRQSARLSEVNEELEREISERARAEERQRQSEQRYNQVLDEAKEITRDARALIGSTKFKSMLKRAVIVPIALMLVLAGVLLWQIKYLLDTAEWVDHTDQVIAQANNIRTLLSDMESGQRGYLLTGNAQFLELYTRAVPEIDPSFERLSRLVSDNPPQVERLAEIQSLSRQWRDYAVELTKLRDQNGDYQAYVNKGVGKRLMDTMRAQFVAFEKTEESLRDERSRAAQQGTKIALGTGVSLTLLLGVILAFLTRRQMVKLSRGYGKALAVTRQQTEALRESEEKFRAIIETTHDWIWSTDSYGKLIYNNPAVETILGYNPKELSGKSVLPFMHKDDRQEVEKAFPAIIAEKRGWTAWVIKWRHKDGSHRYLEGNAVPILNEAGELIGYHGTNRDITERKQAEEALVAGEERYRRLVEMSPETIAIHSEGVFRYINAAGAKLFGASCQEELTGKPILEIVHPDYREHVLRRVRQNLDGGTQSELSEQKLLRLDGQTIDAEVTGIPTTYQGKAAVQIVVRDVTERKGAEAERRKLEEQLLQAQKLESVGTLAGGVAHDFNNLLTVISGNTQLALARLQPDSAARPRLIEIDKAADRAATLTRQLLAFSRRQQLARKNINLNDTIHEIMKLLRRVIGEDVEVRFHTSTSLAPVFADPSQVEQVVMNLAINARDAMPDGGQLVIETNDATLDRTYLHNHPLAKPGRYAQITVSDTGTGMDTETRERIFEPFFTTKAIGKGTGLGLAMVYGIVKQHDGLIEVYSELGQGTTFKIYLPIMEKAIADETQQAQAPLRGGTETILLAEDEEPLRELARTVLEELGYRVMLASNGEEAVAIHAANREQIDLMILDVVMPRMGGHEAYKHMDSSGSGIPVLFMTGYSAEMVQSRFVESAGVPLMQKPYSIEVLGRKVREVLDAAAKRFDQGANN